MSIIRRLETIIDILVSKKLDEASSHAVSQYAKDQQFWRDVLNREPTTNLVLPKMMEHPEAPSLPDNFVDDTVRDHSLEYTFHSSQDFDEQETVSLTWFSRCKPNPI